MRRAWDDGVVRRPGPIQALRGLVAGVLTTFLALLFHIIGGGTSPGALAVAICGAAVCWVAMLVGRSRPSLPLLIASIGVAQVVLHTAFSMATATATISGHAHAGHDDLVVVAMGDGHAMWPAHLLAGVLTIVAIRRGELVLRRLLELAGIAAGALVRLVVAVLGVAPRPRIVRTSPVAFSACRIGAAQALGSVVRRRGPPALAA